MLKVKFYKELEDSLIKFAVIVARTNHQWIFCRHRDRLTYEIPGGHRELGESIWETANRELYEETGAVDYQLKPVCVYSVTDWNEEGNGEETFGMLYYAEVNQLGPLPGYEIEEVILVDEIPSELTYPLIQPKLMEQVQELISIK